MALTPQQRLAASTELLNDLQRIFMSASLQPM